MERKNGLGGEKKKRILQAQKEKGDFMSNTRASQQTAVSLIDSLTLEKAFCFYYLSADNNADK